MRLSDTLEVDSRLIKNNTSLSLPPGTTARIEIVSIDPVTGKKIDPSQFSRYINISPSVVSV